MNTPKMFKSICLSVMLLAVGLPMNAQMGKDISAVGPKTEPVNLQRYLTVFYVSSNTGSDKKGDGSRSQPWATVLKALENSGGSGESRKVAILVASGVYNQATIVMREHVDLYGGFDSTTWERNIFTQPTILDGQKARRVVEGANNSRIDGFIITRGRAFGHGGGILCYDASTTITNNRIRENHTVQPADFDTGHIHQAGHLGGGVACLYNSVPHIANNLFQNNWTEIGDGGGLAIYGWIRLPYEPGKILIENNVFVGNRSGVKEYTRNRSSSGAAVVFSHTEASAIFRNNVVSGNQATGRSDAGGVYCEYFASPLIENNWIVGNIGDDDGGGIYVMRDSEPEIRENFIAGNWTTGKGAGGIRVSKEGRAIVENNTIVQNQTGGGVTNVDSRILLRGNIIADNKGDAGLIYNQTYNYFRASEIEGNVIFGNEKGSVRFQNMVGDAPIFRNNKAEGGIKGEGNIDMVSRIAGDGMSLTLQDAEYDENRGTTSVEVKGASLAGGVLEGRTLHLGDQWRVVRGNDGSEITVWGHLEITPGETQAEILPTYTLVK